MSNMGANLTTEGCNFKVWAPNAQEVFVVGDFNSWDTTKNKLDKNDSDGTWLGFVGEAKAEDKYKYYIVGPTWSSQPLWKPDPYARQMEHSAGSSIIKDEKVFIWEDSEFKPVWIKGDCNSCFEEAVIYELHVGTFSGKNDGFEKNGNFKKLISKLDYLEKLGINTIEILPIHENMFDFYLGYAPVALMPIESSYGTGITDGKAYDELKEFINEAHKKNISVIVDVVFNHLLKIDADNCDDKWLLNYDGDTFYDKGGIYFSGNMTKWGPAINWEKDEIKKYVEDTCRFYLDELHIDGLRWDVTDEIKNKPNGWNAMREIIWNLKESTKNKIFIAEQLPYEKAIVESGNFDLSWFVGYHHTIEKELGGQQDKEGSVDGGINCEVYSRESKKIVYSMSHDEARDGSQYLSSQFGGRDNWDSRAKCRLIGALQFFIPGIPMLFQGEEFLQDGIFDDDYDHAVNWSYQMDGIGLQMQEMYKEAINKRKYFTALRYGELALTHPKDSNQVIAFIRKDLQNNETILVIVNFGGANWENYGICTGSESGRWMQIFCNQENNYGGWEWSGNAYSEPSNNGDKIEVNVPKYGVIVMKLYN